MKKHNEKRVVTPSTRVLSNGKFQGYVVHSTFVGLSLSGEEIVVLCPDERGTEKEAIDDAEKLAEKYRLAR